MATKQKMTIYLSEFTLREILAEAARLDRTTSWVVERSCLLGLKDLHERYPSVAELPGGDANDRDQELTSKAS